MSIHTCVVWTETFCKAPLCVQDKESGTISMVYVVKIKTTLGRQQRSQYDLIIKRAVTLSKQTDFMFGMRERGSSGYLPRTDTVTVSKAKALLE